MIKNIYSKTILIFLIFICAIGSSRGQAVTRITKAPVDVENLALTLFAKGKTPPFSFIYGGISSKEFIRKWKHTVEKQSDGESGIVQYLATYTESETGLKVECEIKGYPAFKALEWTIHFTNRSAANSKNIKQVKVIDMEMEYPIKGNFNLHYADGNHISKYDFHPRTLTLKPGDSKLMEPINGRSSEGDYLPIFNIESASSQGVFVGIGWSGSWYADISCEKEKKISIASGMKTMDLYLYGKESVRTPSITLMYWNSNDRMDGHNQFRRFVLDHKTHKINGKNAPYPLATGFNYKDPAPYTEYSSLTVEYAIAMMKRYKQFNIMPEVFWLDAGWNTGAADWEDGKSWANTVGNWTVDTTRFPNGLRSVSEEAHRLGAKFMVWFEPERVIRGTQWAVAHPEWMLDIPEHNDDTYLMFDLGNPEACDWLCKYIGNMIEENGIDHYRQDFNMHPDIYWTANEEEGRIGMKEIRHIENLYKFWDYLLNRFPNLFIDNCASGGKRIDMETIPRSAPLWRSDYYHYDDPDGYQCHTYGLNFFLPLHGTGILQTDPYAFRSSMSTCLTCNWKITDKSFSIYEMQARLNEFQDIRPYYYEDYYPLTGIGDTTLDNIWLAYQLNRPSDDTGIIVAFRRKASEKNNFVVKLSAIKPEKKYEVTDLDKKESVIVLGRELADQFVLTLDKPNQSLLIKYRVVN
jgi:alpha-galactosidase